MLDVHQLNVFLTAAEMLNFTQAARLLHMTQPSVSQHVSALEKQLGIELFNREGRQISLTDAGAMLVPMAREMVAQATSIEETIRSLAGMVYGHLQVGCSTTPGKYILPGLLAAFHRIHPQVRVTCQVTAQHMALDALNEGEAHFALASRPTATYRNTEFLPFCLDEIVMIVPRDHPWAEVDVIEPDMLYETQFIMREPSSGTQAVVNQTLHEAGIDVSALTTVLTLGNSEAIALAVQEGIGVGFVSTWVIDRLVQRDVTLVAIRGLRFEREIFFGRYTGRPPTQAQAAFWAFVLQEVEAVSA